MLPFINKTLYNYAAFEKVYFQITLNFYPIPEPAAMIALTGTIWDNPATRPFRLVPVGAAFAI